MARGPGLNFGGRCEQTLQLLVLLPAVRVMPSNEVQSSCCLLMLQVQRDSRHVGKFSTHQLEILTEAAAQGRRRVKVQQIAQELALPREEVLHFIKDFASRPENR